jgi:hypothetical protein
MLRDSQPLCRLLKQNGRCGCHDPGARKSWRVRENRVNRDLHIEMMCVYAVWAWRTLYGET